MLCRTILVGLLGSVLGTAGAQTTDREPAVGGGIGSQATPPPQAQQSQVPSAQGPASSPGNVSVPGSAPLSRRTPEDRTPSSGSLQPPQSTGVAVKQTVLAGTEFRATLDQALSTASSHTGQSFTTTLAQPLANADGIEVVAAGAKLYGEVTEAKAGKAFPSIRGPGRLNLRFHSIALSDGARVPLQATLRGIQGSAKGKNARVTQEGEITSGTSGSTAAKDVAIAAVVGTLAGSALGAPLKGLLVGILGGGGYVLAEAGKNTELPAQTTLIVRLDQNLKIHTQSK